MDEATRHGTSRKPLAYPTPLDLEVSEEDLAIQGFTRPIFALRGKNGIGARASVGEKKLRGAVRIAGEERKIPTRADFLCSD